MAVATLPKFRGQKTEWATPEYGVCPWPSRRFTVAEYHRLAELEIFHPEEKCELLEGWITEKNPPPAAWEVEGSIFEADIWPYPIRKFNADEYHLLIACGFFGSNPKFELLEGWITPKIPIDPSRSRAVRSLCAWFHQHLGADWIASVQQPIRADRSEPEPDITIFPGPESKYDGRHPSGRETALVIEVANSSLKRDQEIKLPVFAANGVSQYWIVNLIDNHVEVYTQPRGGKAPANKSRIDYVKGQEIRLVLAGKSVGSLPVSEFLA